MKPIVARFWKCHNFFYVQQAWNNNQCIHKQHYNCILFVYNVAKYSSPSWLLKSSSRLTHGSSNTLPWGCLVQVQNANHVAVLLALDTCNPKSCIFFTTQAMWHTLLLPAFWTSRKPLLLSSLPVLQCFLHCTIL